MTSAAATVHTRSKGTPRRSARSRQIVNVGLWLVIIASALLVFRALPSGQIAALVHEKSEALGAAGPIIFGVIYVLAALLLVPGSALTIVAGATFGLLWGTILVSIASTIAAGLAFLIARYLARARVERLAQRYRAFDAIDKSIAQGGWKIVALLRLSPVVPFSVANYLLGLTRVRFWPHLLASWITMLPGTFLYVYLGYLGGQAALAAGGGAGGAGGETNPWQWVLWGVGLLATIVVTVYVTRLARKALKETAMIQDEPRPPRTKNGPASKGTGAAAPAPAPPRRIWPLVTAAAVMAALAACAQLSKDRLSNLLGPPEVTLKEAYENKPGGPVFDHSRFDALLRKHVTEDGRVDYAALKKESPHAELDAYIASIGSAPIDDLGRDERLALLINACNAFTLRLILDHYPLKSIQDIPENARWDGRKWQVGPHSWTLNEIEHEQIRPKFKEPRIHFALVCAAVGCPILRQDAYRADRLDEQLEAQAKYVHDPAGGERWFQFDSQRNVVRLTPLYDWYGGDFKQVAGSVLKFAARYSPELKAALDAGKEPTIEWLDYDWSLNDSALKERAR